SIWADVMKIEKEQVGIDADFFQSGGHSLRATTLLAGIYKKTGVKIPLLEIFNNPTIRALAGYIRNASPGSYVAIEPVEEKEYYELSSAQKRLFFIQEMTPQSINYNLLQVFRLELLTGAPPSLAEKLQEIAASLIQRHESFRTSFFIKDGKPLQRIKKAVEFKIEQYTAAGEEETKNTIEAFVRPFDLSQPPLMRLGLVKIPGEKHLMLVDMHHIITDGVSLTTIIKEFASLYVGRVLPGITLQYKDFSQWQNELIQTGKMKLQEEYWVKQFEKEVLPLNLPVDFETTTTQTDPGGTLDFSIDGDVTAALKQLALQRNSTLFMVLLAVFNILLSKLSGQEDIVVGTSTAGRRLEELQPVIGMFVNTLPLRNFPSAEKNFTRFLDELSVRTIEAFENQDYQFDDLVEKVVVERYTSQNPLFNVMFILQNLENAEIELPDLRLTELPQETGLS
ncbi:MAG: non-ribosomal peptide synthetase, partial [bacterium]|nr:non-ribosomal peptide synthetase [bacterium]